VGFGLEVGKEVLNDAKQPFETAGGQISKGDIGGAAASAGYGILNIFNPFKKLKILEKVGKIGKKRQTNQNFHKSGVTTRSSQTGLSPIA
jgi:hypothetical protein